MVVNQSSFDDYIKPVDYSQGKTNRLDRNSWAKKVKAEFQKYAQDDLPLELMKQVFEFPGSRLNSHSNRSYFVKSIAEYILTQQGRMSEWFEFEPLIIKLALCSEMMISVQYYHNFIFDGKRGVNTPLLIRETLIKGHLLKSWLFRYIDNAFSSDGLNSLVAKETDKAFNQTDIGQFIEGRYNSYEFYKKHELENESFHCFSLSDKNIDWEVIESCVNILNERLDLSEFELFFLRMYYLRIYLTGSSLYSTFTGLLVCAFNFSDDNKKKLVKFSDYYGIMMQIVNDNNDFVPRYMDQDTKSKYPQDQQSDIRNKNITLPLFLFLYFNERSNSSILRTLEAEKYKGYSERREKRAFEEIVPLLNQYSIPIGEKIIEKAVNIINNDQILSSITEIAYKNKFYEIILDK